MSDQQQPPSGDVPPVPPAYAPAPPAPPTYAPAPPAPPAYAPAPVNAPTGAPGFPAPFDAPVPQAAPLPQAAPPGAYQVPVGGYPQGTGAYQVPAPAAKSAILGILALILAILAAVVAPIVAGISGVAIGQGLPAGIDTEDPAFLSMLSPVRDQVLAAEIAFWAGTVMGLAAIVLGIIAIRRRSGRGAGIAALVLAAIGPFAYGVVAFIALSIGVATGTVAP